MGIIIPRPPMRKRERRSIEKRLRDFEAIMAKLTAAGIPPAVASEQAYRCVRAGMSPDATIECYMGVAK